MPFPQAGGSPDAREGGGGLDIELERDGRSVVLTVRGEVDMGTVPILRERLAQALDLSELAVVVDLHEVGLIDSSGLAALLNALRRLTRARRRLILVCDKGPVLRILQLTRLDSSFTIRASSRQALAELEARAAA